LLNVAASDYEPTHGLQRAVSCDSIASDISVMELEPEAPKVGQLEFGLEYDRYVSYNLNKTNSPTWTADMINMRNEV